MLAIALALPAPAKAQNPESEADRRVQEAIGRQEEQAGVRQRRCLQGSNPAEAIIVCAPRDPEANRLPLRDALESAQSLDDGLPRAPEVGGGGIFKGPATLGGLCLVPPCPKAPAYIVDIAALPADPPESDAARIGRGEIARPATEP